MGSVIPNYESVEEALELVERLGEMYGGLTLRVTAKYPNTCWSFCGRPGVYTTLLECLRKEMPLEYIEERS